jgi:hypothetical protein
MANKQVPDEEKINQLILDVVKKEKPETTEQLVKLVQMQTELPRDAVMQALIKMENKDLLRFTKKEPPFTYHVPSVPFLKKSRLVLDYVSTGLGFNHSCIRDS